MSDEQAAATAAPAKEKKSKKLSKEIKGNVLTIIESSTNTTLTFDAGSLPAAIQANLMPYGLSQKLGDAAAGKEGQEAVDAINKVWEGLSKGDWSVRVPAGPKVSTKTILDNYNAMPEGELKDKAKAMLIALGVMKA
jgi:hypothetical protein